MDDVVAVAVELETGQRRYFLTWGRIFDAVDGTKLEELALEHARSMKLDGVPVRARLCVSLQEAAREPYFFECLFDMSQKPIPFGDGYQAWKGERATRLKDGKDWWYLGVPE